MSIWLALVVSFSLASADKWFTPTWFSGVESIPVASNTFDLYMLDTTSSVYPATLLQITVSFPFNNTADMAQVYVSSGPGKGTLCTGYPDPTHFDYTNIVNGQFVPTVNIYSPMNKQFFVLVKCSTDECSYSLDFTMTSSTGVKLQKGDLRPMKVEMPVAASTCNIKGLYATYLPMSNNVVNYNEWVTSSVPVFKSSLLSLWPDNPKVCLEIEVIALNPSYLFYQQVALTPDQNVNVDKWQTRPVNTGNPLTDLSGELKLPYNHWLSLPTKITDLPDLLYHSVIGEGGLGQDAPWPNMYAYTAMWVLCNQ